MNLFRSWRRASLALALALLGVARAAAAQTADTLHLAEAARAAVASDPRLAGAAARLDQARATRGVAAAGRRPSVASSALVVRHGEPMIVAPLHRLDPEHLPDFDPTLVQGRAVVSQLLYDGGAVSGRVRAAEGTEEAARASMRDVSAAVLEELVAAYVGVLNQRDVLIAESERALDLEAELDRASRMFDEGASPRLALLRAGSELSASRAEVEAARARLRLAEATLASRMDVPPEEVASRPLRDILTLAEAGAPPGAGAPEEPPAVAAARARVAAAAARVSEAAASRRPRLFATGAIQEFGGGSTEFSTEWLAGVQIEYPIFSGGATGHAIERARAELREAEAELAEVRRVHAEGALEAGAARSEALARAAALEDRVSALEELVRVERLALEEGAGVQRDFLDAAGSFAEARAGLGQARRAALLAEVRLARLTGVLGPEWLEAVEARR
jgi:outer membrane protein TolC